MSRKEDQLALQQNLQVGSRRRIAVEPEVRAAFVARVVAAGKGAPGEDTVKVEEGEPANSPAVVEASNRAAEPVVALASEQAEALTAEEVKPERLTPPKTRKAKPAQASKSKGASKHDGVISPAPGVGTKHNPRKKKNGMSTRFTTIHFDSDLLDWLQLDAALNRRTLSEVVNEASERWLKSSGTPHPGTLKKTVKGRAPADG